MCSFLLSWHQVFPQFFSSKKLLITLSQLIVFRVTLKTLVIMEGIMVVTVDM